MTVGGGGSNPGHPDDPWAVLGIPSTADDTAIRTAYRSALRGHPPESDAEGFKRIRAAYEALRDPDARAKTTLFGRFLLPPLPPTSMADLGARPASSPTREELLQDLKWVLLSGTELQRTDFGADLRPPPD